MTKKEVIKQLQWKRDKIYDMNSTNDKDLKLIYKIQKDTCNMCIKLIEQI